MIFLAAVRVLLQELAELVVDDLGDDPLDVGVGQLDLGLALELRVGHLDADDRREAFLEVLAGDRQVLLAWPGPRPWRSVLSVRVRAVRKPVRCVPPSIVLMLLQYETTFSLIESLYCNATSTSTAALLVAAREHDRRVQSASARGSGTRRTRPRPSVE